MSLAEKKFSVEKISYHSGVVAWDPEDDLVASCLVFVTASLIDLGGQDVGVNLASPRLIYKYDICIVLL